MNVDHRLATYGTLAPGRPNHHLLADVPGVWLVGQVKGHLTDVGWGAAIGFPALVLADTGPTVEIHLFLSAELPAHWERLDAFEGQEYRRTRVQVETAEGPFEAWIYLAADPVL